MHKFDWSTVFLVLSIKALIFLFASQVLLQMSAWRGWVEIWNHWDAPHYLDLARNGYVNTGKERFWIVFYPLYPWLIRVAAVIWRNYLWAAFFVSGVASIAAALLLKRLAMLDHGEAVAKKAVWFLLIFPTSYFLHIGYTESLFLALTLGCFFAARTDRWALAGALGAAACLTRVNGLLLMPALAVEAWQQYRHTRRIDFRWLWIGFVATGFAIYLWLNYSVTGDFFAFSKTMEQQWYKKLTPPWVGLSGSWHEIVEREPSQARLNRLDELVASVIGLLCAGWCFWRLRPSYGVWVFANWLLITSTSFLLSVPRYLLTFFPIFILFALAATSKPYANRMITAASLLFLGLYVSRFSRGYWAF